MRAIILSIGDELVLGQTVDTNSAWLSQQLAAAGCDVVRHATVGDAQPDIESAISDAAPACDLLLISGGLGPTEDDLTRQALAAVMGVSLELDEPWLARLEEFFRTINRPMSPLNRVQAMIPRGAAIVENTNGTAAGIAATLRTWGRCDRPAVGVTPDDLKGRPIGRVLSKIGRVSRAQVIEALTLQKHEQPRRLLGQVLVSLGYVSESTVQGALAAQHGVEGEGLAGRQRLEQMFGPLHECRAFVMPGVPKEMKAMFTRDVLPFVRSAAGGAVILSRTLHTFGLGESNVADNLKSHGDLMNRGRNPSVGTTVSAGVVSLRLNARFPDADQATRELDATEAACRQALGDLIYGRDEDTLPAIVGGMLKQSGRTVTTAESCTGGLVAKYLTDLPGSSTYFHQAWVTYSNEAKQSLLGVPADLLRQFGAVSEPVARAMAEGARSHSGADFALALSGIAGPDGGTPTKPVGTVCIALASGGDTYVRTIVFTGDREMVRDRSAKMALTFLRFALLAKSVPF